jgi:methyl-accepting chemotaxis protein
MKWTVGTKIAGGFGLALICLVMIGVVAYLSTTGFIRNTDWVVHSHDVLATQDDVLSSLINAQTGQRGYLLTGEVAYLEPYTSALTTIDNDMKHLRMLTVDNAAQQRRLDLLEPLIDAIRGGMRDSVNLRRSKGSETAGESMRIASGKKTMDDIRKVMSEFKADETRLLQLRNNELHASSRTTLATILFGIPLAIILISAAGYFITGNIVRPLGEITRCASRIAEGELDNLIPAGNRKDEIGILAQTFTRMGNSLNVMAATAQQIAAGDLSVTVIPQSERDVMGTSLAGMVVSLKNSAEIARQIAVGNLSITVQPRSGKDVMGNALADMVRNLKELTTEIIEGINVIAVSSSEIIASTTQVASGAAETSAAVSETTTSVEEVKQTAQVANQKARNVSEAAQKSVQIAQGGRRAVDDSITVMTRIQTQVKSIAESIVRLSEQSLAIGEIIATVNDLAEQSNLLAVNAAIEAARAGEQGKGFAVVAQEVKSLAEQSKEATTQVRAILNDIQKATNAAVLATEQGSKAVEEGVRQSREAGEAIRLMGASIDESAQAAIQITVSSQQQLIGMDQVVQAMGSIRQASEQNVTGMRQVEITVQGLHGLGQKLKDLVARFKV